MNVENQKPQKSPSSLPFLSAVLLANSLSACLWLVMPVPLLGQICGLILSFLTLVVLAKNVWEINLLRGEEAAKNPAHPQSGINELQAFLVDHLQFAVITVFPGLGFRMETKRVPMGMGALKVWENKKFAELLEVLTRLPSEDISMLAFQMEHAFGMDHIQWNVTLLGLPREAQLRSSPYVRLNYVPEFVNGLLQSVHVIIQDISEIKQREEQALEQRREMEKFFAVLQVPDSLFELFMSETRRLFEEIRTDLRSLKRNPQQDTKEIANRMFRAVHTIKANARLFKLNSIQDVAHKVESYLDSLRNGRIRTTIGTVQELTQRIQLISEEVYSYASMRKEILSSSGRNSDVNFKYRLQWIRSLMGQFSTVIRDPQFQPSDLDLIQSEFSRALASFDRSSLREYVRGYEAMLQEMASQLGKEVELRTDIEFHQFDSSILTKVNDVILHCLRNAVDHGIEGPEQREALGKSRCGVITLSTRERNGMIEIELRDDGRGIDVERVRSKAVELGILSAQESEQLSDESIVPLLFNVGVSTATTVTEISGRGLGLDVVRDQVYGLNGQLRLGFAKGRSTTISFAIPVANDEFTNPMAIHDLGTVVEQVAASMPQEGRLYTLKSRSLSQGSFFGDSKLIAEAIQLTLQEMGQRFSSKRPCQVVIEEHFGKRKVDSFVFYRLKIGDMLQNDSRLPLGQEKAFEVPTQLLRKSGGSLYVRGPSMVEINLPSNIPVPFADYTFKLMIFSRRTKDFELPVEHFFEKIMGGWHHKVYAFSEKCVLPEELKRAACLVLLDSKLIPDYLASRDELDRVHDSIILFPEGELDIDALNETSIVPENLLFAAPSFDEKHLHRVMVSIVFRRFLDEMVREKNEGMIDLDNARIAS